MSGRHRDDIPGDRPGGGGYDPGARPGGAPQEGAADWFTPRESQGGPVHPGGGQPGGADVPQWFTPRGPAAPGGPGDPRSARPPAANGGGYGGDPSAGAPPAPGRFSGASDAGGHGLGRPAGTSASYSDRGYPGGGSPGDVGPGRPGGRPTSSSGPYESLSSSSDGYDSTSGRSSGGPTYGSAGRGGSGGSGDSGGYGSGGYGSGGYGSGGYGSGGYGSGGYGSGGYGSGEYGRRKGRRSAAALIGPLAGAVGLALLLGVGVYAVAQSGGCSDDAINLTVSTAPDVAPAVNSAVSRFNDQKRKVGDKCVQAAVTTADPAAVTTLLSGQGVSSGASKRPDVWIPDSSLWLNVISSTTKGKVKLTATKTSVAQSPIVVALPRTLAVKLAQQGMTSNPSWDNLLSAGGGTVGGAVTKNQVIPESLVKLSVTDPTRHGAGMTMLVIAQMLVTNDPNAASIFTGIVRTMRDSTTPDIKTQMAAFKRQTGGKFPVALLPEQAVWKHNTAKPAEPAIAIYPTEGTLNVDYPFTITAESSEKAEAARLLEQAMNTETTRNEVRGLGFRSSDGKAPSTFGEKTGVNPQRPRQLPAPAANSVEQVVQAWSKLSLGIRLLTLIDVSGSMGVKVPGTNVTRMQATAQIAQGGLSLMPDDTELGHWVFSTNLVGKQDWREEVPMGPLGERIGSSTRRQQLLAALSGLRPIPNGNTGLYDSLLAAFRNMKKTYKPEMINSLLLLTDGKNEDPEGIALPALLATLKREYDPNRPVQVIMIGFGQGVDRNELDQIAKVTRGSVSVANRPEEIQKIFLQAISRRVCSPNC